VEGKLKTQNLFAFLLYAILYLIVQALVFVNLHYTILADINIGIISSIWNL